MSYDPHHEAGAELREAREAARRHARALPGPLVALLGGLLAALFVVAFVVLDYHFGQAQHRLVKILLGVTGVGLILTKPRFGLWLLPIVTPFLGWLPVLPVPGLNPLNLLVFSVFFTFALQRVIRREPFLRHGDLDTVILVMVVLIALSVVRGVAFPTGYEYDGANAGVQTFRVAMTFSVYFITLAMSKGEKDRRAIATAVILGLVAESAVTVLYGRSGRGGRANGSFGQPNELGAYLVMYTAFAAAMLTATRRLWLQALLAGTVVLGTVATLFTVSRSALMALGLGLGYVALRSSRMMLVVLLAAAVSSPLWIPDYMMERITTTQIEVEGEDAEMLEGSAQLRIDTWRAITDVVTEHPLDGVGFTGLGYVLPATGAELGVAVKDSAHNTYMRMLGEMGIGGLLVFVWFLWACFRLGWDTTARSRSGFDRQLGVGIGAATLAMALSCAFGDRFLSILITGPFWMLCALASDRLAERRAEAA